MLETNLTTHTILQPFYYACILKEMELLSLKLVQTIFHKNFINRIFTKNLSLVCLRNLNFKGQTAFNSISMKRNVLLKQRNGFVYLQFKTLLPGIDFDRRTVTAALLGHPMRLRHCLNQLSIGNLQVEVGSPQYSSAHAGMGKVLRKLNLKVHPPSPTIYFNF